MSGKLEIILCCNSALKRPPITMRHSALTVKLLNCQSGYQRSPGRRVWVLFLEAGGQGVGVEEEKEELGNIENDQ